MMRVVKTYASFPNMFSIIFCGPVLCLIDPCLPGTDANSSYSAPTFWSEPIADYLISREENYPDGFNRSITALYVSDGRLWLVLSGDGMKNEPFAVHRFRENSMEELELVQHLGFEAASSITYWMGDLVIGTPGGNVLRTIKEQG